MSINIPNLGNSKFSKYGAVEIELNRKQQEGLRKSFYRRNNPPVYKYDNLGFWSAPKEPVTKRIQAGLKDLAKNVVKLLRK